MLKGYEVIAVVRFVLGESILAPKTMSFCQSFTTILLKIHPRISFRIGIKIYILQNLFFKETSLQKLGLCMSASCLSASPLVYERQLMQDLPNVLQLSI